MYRGGIGDEGDDLHFVAAGGTAIDLDFEHTGQERSPRQSIFGGACSFPLVRSVVLSIAVIGAGRYDFRSVLGIRRKYSVVSGDVGPRRGHNRRELF